MDKLIVATDREKGFCRLASLLALLSVLSLFMIPCAYAAGINLNVSLGKTDYKINETIEINVSGAPGAMTHLKISGAGREDTYDVVLIGAPITLIYSATESGGYEISADASLGGESEQNLVYFTVLDMPYPYNKELRIEPTIEKSVIGLSESLAFSAQIGGGTPPYSYNWNFNDGTVSKEASGSHLFESAQSYRVYLEITDSSGNEAMSSFAIKVVEEKNTLSVKVVDEENKPVSSANVEISNLNKASDESGAASFASLGGTYILKVSKDGYEENSQSVEITENKDMIIVLRKGSIAGAEMSVEAVSPEDGHESQTSTVHFKFKVSGGSKINECTLYLNDGRLGFKAKESITSPSKDSENEIQSELGEGSYSWKIKCSDDSRKESFSTERKISIPAGAKPEKVESPSEPPAAAPQSEEPQQVASEPDIAKQEEEKVVSGSSLISSEQFLLEDRPVDEKYVSGIVEGVQEARRKIEAGDEKVMFAYNNLGFKQRFEERIKELKDIEKSYDFNRLKTLSGPQFDSEMASIKTRIESAYSYIPYDLVIVDVDSYDWFSVAKDLERVYTDYYKSKNQSLSVSEMADLIQENLFLQKTTNVRFTVYIVEADYISGRKEYFTLVKKDLDFYNYKRGSDFTIFEYIPKEIAQTTKDITFVTPVEIISEDILAKIDRPQEGQAKQIIYYVNRRLHTRLAEGTKTVLLATSSEKVNVITGFVALKNTMSDKSFLIGFGLVLLVAIVYTLLFAPLNIGLSMLHLKSVGLNPPKKLLKQIEEITMLLSEDKVDYAVQVYSKVLGTYNSLGEQEKTMFFELVSHVYNEINMVKMKNLTIRAYAQYKHGDSEGMNRTVVEIEQLFHAFDEKYKERAERMLLEMEQKMS